MKSSILSGSNNGRNKNKNERSTSDMPRYEQIALEIASKIARKHYKQGEKLYGRSALAGQYNVSPETIRRAVALLQSMNVVVAQPGRGIVVGTAEAAEAFIKEFESRYIVQDMCNQIVQLVEERNRLNREIDEILNKLVAYTTRMAGRLQKIEEIQVPRGSYLVGKSLSAVDFRARTGATVLAVERNGEQIFSPDVSFIIQEADILVFVGPPESKNKVYDLVNT